MRIAVTGASGFIGRYLTAGLLADGHEVVALGRAVTGLDDLANVGAAVFATDYDTASLEKAFAGADAVVHLAGRRSERSDDPLAFHPFVEANLSLLERVFFAASRAGAKRFVLASSIAVYSSRNTLPYRTSDIASPLNPYGASKLMGETLVEMWSHQTDLSAVALRFAATYGHGERISAVLMRFIDQAMHGRPLTLTGNTRIAVDQLYVRDAVGAIKAALKCDARGVFNVGAGRAFTLQDMAEAVNRAFDNPHAINRVDVLDSDVRQPYMEMFDEKNRLGWTPEWTLDSALIDLKNTWRSAQASAATTASEAT